MDERAKPRRISFTAVWADTAAMLRANGGLLTAIAGVFLFLPSLLIQRFSTEIELPSQPQPHTPDSLIEAMQAQFAANWGWVVGGHIAAMVGVAAMTVLLLAEPRITVGTALRRGFAAFPFYLVITIVWTLSIVFGFAFFIVPGLFLIGRLCLAHAMLMVESPTAPFGAIARSWRVTGSQSWAASALIVIVGIAAAIIGFIALNTVGVIVILLAGREWIGGFLIDTLTAFVDAVTQVIVTALFAGLYRAFVGRTA